MATELRKAAWHVPIPDHDQKILLVLLCDLPLKGATICTPSRATIMQRTGLDAPALDKALAALKARGLVTWKQRPQTSNEYTVDARALNDQKAQVLGGQRAG